MYSEEEMKKWTVREQQKLELHGLESVIEAEMQIAEKMPVNGFVRDDSGEGEYWLEHLSLANAFFDDSLPDLLCSLSDYLQIVQFESRELVLQGLAFAKAILSLCERNTNHWLSGLHPGGDRIISQPDE